MLNNGRASFSSWPLSTFRCWAFVDSENKTTSLDDASSSAAGRNCSLPLCYFLRPRSHTNEQRSVAPRGGFDGKKKKETMIDRTFPLCKGIILRRGVVKYSHRVNLTARKVVNGLQETIYIRYNVGN